MNQVENTGFSPGLVVVLSLDTTRYTDFSIAMSRLRVPTGTGHEWVKGAEIAHGRSNAVRTLLALPPAYTWLWFIDDDHRFGPDLLLELLGDQRAPRSGYDVLAPLCANRKPPFRPFVTSIKPPSWRQWWWSELGPPGYISKPSLSVATTGMLIQRSLLARMAPPHFRVGQLQPEFCMDDLEFCVRAWKDGAGTVALDTRRVLTHITPMGITPRWDEIAGKWVLDIDDESVIATLDPSAQYNLERWGTDPEQQRK